MKVTIVGAGNVGATCANVIAYKDLCEEVVLLDIKEGLAEGKALEKWQTNSINEYSTKITGVTNDYEATKNSNIVVITSRISITPEMSREYIINTNGDIVKQVSKNIHQYSPNAIIIIVSNPVEVMTSIVQKVTGKDRTKIIGMTGILDVARYKSFLSEELNINQKDISAILMGGHGENMVPLKRYTTISGIPVDELVKKNKLDAILEKTKTTGKELVKLMGISAWHAPGSGAALMVEAIIKNLKRIFPVCIKLEGEYGIKDNFLGVPVILGRNGIEKIIELKLNKEELKLINNSANTVKSEIDIYKNF